MKITHFLRLFYVCLLFAVACIDKQVNPVMPTKSNSNGVITGGNNNPPAASIESLMKKNAPLVQAFTFKNEDGAILQGKKGTIINIKPFTYGISNGKVDIQLTEVYTVPEMLGAGIYTSAYGDKMLNSQGMFVVKAFMNGIEMLAQKDAEITMNIAAGTTPQNTKVFKLVKYIDSFSGISREEWVEYDENWDFDSSHMQKCKFNFKLLTWCNLDAYMAGNGIKNSIHVAVPSGFGPSNTNVFFHLNAVNGVVAMLGDPIMKNFYTYSLKEGLAGKIYLFALKDDIYYLETKDVVFTNTEQTITYTNLTKSSLEGVEAAMKN